MLPGTLSEKRFLNSEINRPSQTWDHDKSIAKVSLLVRASYFKGAIMKKRVHIVLFLNVTHYFVKQKIVCRLHCGTPVKHWIFSTVLK